VKVKDFHLKVLAYDGNLMILSGTTKGGRTDVGRTFVNHQGQFIVMRDRLIDRGEFPGFFQDFLRHKSRELGLKQPGVSHDAPLLHPDHRRKSPIDGLGVTIDTTLVVFFFLD
jgi:hypothetical protein